MSSTSSSIQSGTPSSHTLTSSSSQSRASSLPTSTSSATPSQTSSQTSSPHTTPSQNHAWIAGAVIGPHRHPRHLQSFILPLETPQTDKEADRLRLRFNLRKVTTRVRHKRHSRAGLDSNTRRDACKRGACQWSTCQWGACGGVTSKAWGVSRTSRFCCYSPMVMIMLIDNTPDTSKRLTRVIKQRESSIHTKTNTFSLHTSTQTA